MASVSPAPGIGPYNVTKHGVLALSETLLADLRAAGSSIGVTIAMPGRVATGMGLPSGAPGPDFDMSVAEMQSSEEVGEAILAAVERDSLYLFTHPERLAKVRQRFQAILGGPIQA